jgi:hypothetical protein
MRMSDNTCPTGTNQGQAMPNFDWTTCGTLVRRSAERYLQAIER